MIWHSVSNNNIIILKIITFNDRPTRSLLRTEKDSNPVHSQLNGLPTKRNEARDLRQSPSNLEKHVQAKTTVRHKQVILSFLGVTVFGLQVSSLAVGIVAMSDSAEGSKYLVQKYTLKQKGLMSGMMGYGNSIGNVLLLCLAHRCGVVRLLPIASGFFSGTMAIAVPLAAIYVGFEATCIAVLLQGLGLSFVYPCVYAHLSRWVVPQEQAKFSWVWSGHQVGHLIVMAAAGFLYSSPGGWPSVFYIPGIIGLIWGVVFSIWGVSSPAIHQTISDMEKDFLQKNVIAEKWKVPENNRHGTKNHVEVPWRVITTSVALWALLIVQISDMWVAESMMGPVFLHSVCHLSVKNVGLATAIAYFTNIVVGILFAFLAHRYTDTINLNFSRKLWTAIGLYGGAVSLSLLTISGNHCHPAVFFLEARIVLNAATHPGYMSTILNVAPNMAVTVASAFNSITSFVSSTGPLYTGFIVKNEYVLFEWQIVFCTAIIVYFIGCTVYLVFGSTEPQTIDSPHLTTESGRMSASSFDSDLERRSYKRKKFFMSKKLRIVGKQRSFQVFKPIEIGKTP